MNEDQSMPLNLSPKIKRIMEQFPEQDDVIKILELSEELIHLQEQFSLLNPGKKVTRNYYRNIYKHNEKIVDKYFGSFSNFADIVLTEPIKETSQKNNGIHRNDFDSRKGNFTKKVKSKRYFLSAIIPGMEIFEEGLPSVETFCKHNDAELVLLMMRGVSSKDMLEEATFERFQDNIVTEFVFNRKLIAQDFKISPQQFIPETGLNRFGQKEYSVIVATPKQNLTSVARGNSKHPHVIACTACINKPKYNNDRAGKISTQDHIIGGLIIEVKNDEVFFVRQVQFDEMGGFHDGEYYYTGNSIHESAPEAITFGDMHYTMEDPKAIQAQKDFLRSTKAKRVFLHDLLDCASINHHEKDNVINRYFRNKHQKTLDTELKYVGERLKELVTEFPDTEFVVVPSNHDEFLYRWFNDGRFIKDENNARLGAELFIATLDQINPYQYYFSKNFGITNIKFLKRDESYLVEGVECGSHGDKGSNGAKGSARSCELSFGKSTVGHAHSPSIFRTVYIVGTSSLLNMGYNVGPSGWLHAFSPIYANGSRQMIISINGEWRLPPIPIKKSK